jgi:hypothetical protein
MADHADIQSLDALRDFRAALLTFIDDARIALDDVEFDIRRTSQWLGLEQPAFWKGEIKSWERRLNEARADLARKKLAKFSDRAPDTTVEEKKVKRCEVMLEESHRKLKLCKTLEPELQHAVQEYRGQVVPLLAMLENHIPKAAVRLDRLVEAVENYLRVQAPVTPKPAAVGVGAGADTMTRQPPPTPRPEPAVAGESETISDTPGGTEDERQRGGEQAGQVDPDLA